MKIEVEAIDYHRNGICGIGFHVVAFRWAATWRDRQTGETRQDEPRAMVGIVFPEDDDPGYVAVFDREQLRRGNVFMHASPDGRHPGGNAWRGDNFAPALRAAIRDYEADQERTWADRHAAPEVTP